MGKSKFFAGQPIFSQLLQFIPRHLVQELSQQTQADRYCKRFFSFDHLISMLYACFFQVTSLRELTTGLLANSHRLEHLGITNTPRRSTLSDANTRRDAVFFERLYHRLYQMYFPDSRAGLSKENELFIVDSSTITLFSNVMQGAGTFGSNGKKKGGVKVHTLINAQHDLPAFVRITEARHTDVSQLQHLSLPAGSVIVFDKGYTSYQQFNQWDQQNITWISRCRKGATYCIDEKRLLQPESAEAGVISDQWVTLGRPSNEKVVPLVKARLILFYDNTQDRHFEFITNDDHSSPEQIAHYYKKRWQIELLFKRIKQRYPLRYFLGDTPNAIKIQIWCALICDLLVKVVMNQLNRIKSVKWSYANLAAMIKHHLMTYINLIEFLKNPEKAMLKYKPPEPQLKLWGLQIEKPT